MIRRKQMIEKLEPRTLLSASLVKDINPTQYANPGLWGIFPVGSFAYLSHEDVEHGWELWRTDGTTAGTTLVKDIRPGIDGSVPGNFVHIGGGSIYFTANDGTHGVELWKSDGTEAGTALVKDINPGAASANASGLTYINGTLYFSANDGTGGSELWKSDGTEAGTILVKEIAGGTTGSNPAMLVNNNGVLFFSAVSSTSGRELWKSDGTEAGTVMVKDLASGSSSGVEDLRNLSMVALNGFVYFVGNDTFWAADREIWKSDGTDAGTTMVRDLSVNNNFPSFGNLKVSGSFVYFTLSGTGTNGLWRTDGTSAGTLRMHTEVPYVSADVNDTFFFAAGATATSRTLYKTDGTSVTPLRSGLAFGSFAFANGNGTLYFAADDAGGAGEELWKSDGTPGGTGIVKDIAPGPTESGPYIIVGFGGPGEALLGAFTPEVGGGLFKTDGTDAGTQLVKDIFRGTDIGMGFFPTVYKNELYFMAFDGVTAGTSGGELYKTDGTDAGTQLVIDLAPGLAGANIRGLRVFGDYLYFNATNGTSGNELWRTDGTAVGTTLVKDIETTDPAGANPGGLTVSGNFLFFEADTTTHGPELWRTDGTESGTIRLTDINPGAGDSQISDMTDVDGWLYFSANNSFGFAGLFRTNGWDVLPVSSSFTAISTMLNVDGTLYISGTTSTHGQELFKLEPGAASPVLVKDIVPFSSGSAPALMTDVDGTLFFVANATGGRELWKSDGTDAGTVRVKDINPSGNSSPQNLVAANGVLYFSADDGTAGPFASANRELWRSDGTAAGTYLLKDIAAGATPGGPTRLYAANGYVYFAADDGVNGLEAWRSDGTAEGTAMIGDYMPEGTFIANFPANAAFFTAMGGDVYYRFNDYAHGDELWKAEQPDFAVLGAGGALAISGTGGNDVIDIAADAAGGVTVTLNGLVETFAPGQVTSVNVVGHIGRDTLTVSAGTVEFGGDAGAATANLALRVAPGASAVFNASQRLADLDVDGTATLSRGAAKVIVTKRLSVDGRLNLSDNDLVLDYQPGEPNPVAEIQARIASAYNFTQWNGTGITTDMADAKTGLTTLGIGDAAEVFGLTAGGTRLFSGVTVDATSVVVMYTYAGDANLDGQIDAGDYGRIDNFVQVAGANGYWNGDFNYDGFIDAGDYGIIDNNIQAQAAAAQTEPEDETVPTTTVASELAARPGKVMLARTPPRGAEAARARAKGM